jgi:hypothetical protein
MDIIKIKRNYDRIRKKRKNEGINKRKYTLIKKAYKLGEFDNIDVALIICKHGRYTTYRSRDHTSWPPSIAEIKRLLAWNTRPMLILIQQTAYPPPKDMLPEDIEKCLSKHTGGKKFASEE